MGLVGAREIAPAPETREDGTTYEMHGETIADPYRWLEDDASPEVEAWDRAQQERAEAYLGDWSGAARLQKRIDEELGLGGMPSLPTFRGGRAWFTYRPEGANHAVLYVTDPDSLGGSTAELIENSRLIIDPNLWSEDGTEAMKAWIVSPNGSYIAVRRDSKGSEDTTLYVLDVVTGRWLEDRIPRTKFSPVVWSADSKGFFYTRMPDPSLVPDGEEQYHGRIRYHRLGTLPLDDAIVYGKGTPQVHTKWIYESSDSSAVLLSRGEPYGALDTFEVTGEPGNWQLEQLWEAREDRSYVDKVGDTYLINTDQWRGERDLVYRHRLDDGTLSKLKDVRSFGRDRGGPVGILQEYAHCDGRLVVHMREDVVSHLYLIDSVRGGEPREIALPGPGAIGSMASRPGDSRLWIRFESFSHPLTDYVVDTASEGLHLKKLRTLPTTADTSALVSEMIKYKSVDGTEIPLFITRHKDTKLDGSAPTVVYGYGGFRSGMYPYFSRSRTLWLEMGGVWCVACLRGGDEYGEAWHEAGMLGNKQNVYDDFIAACDYLVENEMASREKLAIWGGSNGGLLTAVCVNQRPDLCAAGISSVPLTDMLR